MRGNRGMASGRAPLALIALALWLQAFVDLASKRCNARRKKWQPCIFHGRRAGADHCMARQRRKDYRKAVPELRK